MERYRRKFVLALGASIDTMPSLLEEFDIEKLDVFLEFNNQRYRVTGSSSAIPLSELYRRLRAGNKVEVSPPTVEQMVRFFVDILKKRKKDIIFLTQCYRDSPYYQTAVAASRIVMKSNPQFSIAIIPIRTVGIGSSFLLQKLHEYLNIEPETTFVEACLFLVSSAMYQNTVIMRDVSAGFYNNFKKSILKVHYYKFTHITKRGRESRPITYNSKTKAIRRALTGFETRATELTTVYISHGDCADEAIQIKRYLKENYPEIKRIVISEIGPLGALKYGPDALILYYFGPDRDTIVPLIKFHPVKKFHLN